MKHLFRNLGLKIAALACCVMMVACDKDNDDLNKHGHLEFTAEGISLTKWQDGFMYAGNIPAEGSKFTITGKGKYVDMSQAESMTLDGKNLPKQNVSPIFSGDWGQVNQVNNEAPYKTEVSISANTSGEYRDFEIQFGHGEPCVKIKLTQAPQKK